MHHWSIDIIRQSGFDLWTWVCVAASMVLLSYALLGRLWTSRRGWLAYPMIAAGVVGTAIVLSVPALRTPFVGLAWTFVLLCLLSATFYLNLHEQLGTRRTATLLGMRILALAMLVPMLFEPVLRYISQPKPERPIAFLIDTSGSMSFPDVQNGPSRIQSVWQTLRPQLPKIDQHFIPTFYTFDTAARELKKPDDLARAQADGKATDIAAGISKARSDLPPEKDPAIILISDGIDNVSPNVTDAIHSGSRKIYTVSVGSPQAAPATLANVAVDNVSADDDFTVGRESNFKALIKSTALANRLVDVKMAEVDAAGKPAGEVLKKQLILQPIAEGQTVELQYTPHSVGVHKLAVWIDPIAGERSTVDNRQEFQGLALDPRVKLLYIEGRIRPEYKYLIRLLGHDPNIELATLPRVQKELFKPFGTVDGQPFTQMPQTPQEWKKFDVILLGDLDASFLTRQQQEAIEQRTADGGGLLMIGGQRNFGPGGYKDTPIEKALPVFVGDSEAPQEKSEFVPRLTSEGLAHPAMQGLDGWFPTSTKKPPKDLQPLLGNVVVPRAKSGAEVLLDRIGADGKTQIILAVQRYGKGRSAAFTADTTYRWSLELWDEKQDSPYNRFWGQLIRWLAGTDVRNRQNGPGLDGLLNKTVYQFGEGVKVRAQVRDEHGDATQYAQVSLKLQGGSLDKPLQIPLSTSGRVGMYQTAADPDKGIPSLGKGDYTVDLVATKDGKELGHQQLKFTVIPPEDEMLKIAANPKLMEAIAQATGGFHVDLPELPNLLDNLIRSDPAVEGEQQRSVPLANTTRTLLVAAGANPRWPAKYDLPMQAVLVIALLAVEWVLRRKWQLP